MIGYYVHHQGSGHLRRALAVADRLSTPVTVLSSLPRPTDCPVPWVALPRDDAGGRGDDVDAGGTLHWVPRYEHGLSARAATLTAWLERERPLLMMVDVSVEVALLARLSGTPVVVMAMPGARRDRAHVMAYDLAEMLLAAWPRDIVVSAWPDSWTRKAQFVGAFSRFDVDAQSARRVISSTRNAFLLWGTGGSSLSTTRVDEIVRASPGWTWDVRASSGGLDADQVWSAMSTADVIVSHGGEAAVAEVAAARKPAVLVADDRPFQEQHHTVRAVDRAGIAVGLATWPEAAAWPRLLDRAMTIGGTGWRRWSFGDGAQQAADALDLLARSLSSSRQAPVRTSEVRRA